MTPQKTIFITGAASGIGRATAELFVKRGWYAGLFDISEPQLEALAKTLGKDSCCFRRMDVTDMESVTAAASFFEQATGGKMDALFNNAGVLSMGPYQRISVEVHKKIVDVNINGILNCTHACLELLRGTAGSRIINMSSASSIYGTPELAVYSATKFAVRGLTEALNIEFQPLGITVSDIMAAYVRTPMITEARVQATSVGRMGIRLEPADVAEVVWKAAHGNRVHWRVGLLLDLIVFFSWLLPFTRKTTTRWLAFSTRQ
ncbi:MAG: SDR family oxidoreductase [Thermodesulfobacteriota bacterium]